MPRPRSTADTGRTAARVIGPWTGARLRRSRRARLAAISAPIVVVLLAVPFVPSAAGQAPGAGAGSIGAAGSAAPAVNFSLNQSFQWSELAADAPGARDGAGLAALGSSGAAVLFGGTTPAGLVNSTLIYNESGNAWTPVAPATAPSARSGFGFATVPASSTAILFGGVDNLTSGAVANDTWSYSFANRAWTDLAAADAPPAREEPAFAVGDGIALLYGGLAPNASGSGQLTFFDTWELNLSSDVWSRVVASGPGALYGASLAWDPAVGEFVLFGGCYPCSSALWAFSPGRGTWSAISTVGPTPPGRRDAVWSWDPNASVDLLFGGANGTAVMNDTYLYAPSTGTWTEVVSAARPSARAAAAGDFLDTPGNATLLLCGGANGSVILPDAWRLAPAANLTVLVTNATSGAGVGNATVGVGTEPPLLTSPAGVARLTFLAAAETSVNASSPGYAEAAEEVWLAPGENVTVRLNLTPLPPAAAYVRVLAPNGTALANADVAITYNNLSLAGPPRLTDPNGYANYTNVPTGAAVVLATRDGYHSTSAKVTFRAATPVWLNLTLYSLVELFLHTTGKLPNGTVAPLDGVAIFVHGEATGATDTAGWLNVTTSVVFRIGLEAAVYGFTTFFENISANYSGPRFVNITMVAEPFPILTFEVRGLTGPPVDVLVRNARVNISSVKNVATGPLHESLVTGVSGSVSLIVPPGNFSFQVWARGFAENDSIPTLFAGVSQAINRTFYLAPLPPATVHVLVRSADGSHPTVDGATVGLNFTALELFDGSTYPEAVVSPTAGGGWANFTGIPATLLYVNVSASGFFPNDTVVYVEFDQQLNPYTVWLTPAPPIHIDRLAIFPGTSAVLPLLALPAVSLVGALAYLTTLRNPPARERARRDEADDDAATERPGDDGPPSAPP